MNLDSFFKKISPAKSNVMEPTKLDVRKKAPKKAVKPMKENTNSNVNKASGPTYVILPFEDNKTDKPVQQKSSKKPIKAPKLPKSSQ